MRWTTVDSDSSDWTPVTGAGTTLQVKRLNDVNENVRSTSVWRQILIRSPELVKIALLPNQNKSRVLLWLTQKYIVNQGHQKVLFYRQELTATDNIDNG